MGLFNVKPGEAESAKEVVAYEYARFGDSILKRRAGSTEDWRPCPETDLVEAEVELRVAEKLKADNRTRGAQFTIQRVRGSS